jgi:L-amino acid N-acyltransferase YncA
MTVGPLSDGDGPTVMAEILADLPAFWGDRDMHALHHPVWLHQFASGAVVARDDDVLVGYVLGAITAQGLAYAHLIAVRADARRRGVGRRLYEAFFDGAQNQGAHHVEAITTTANTASIAFHERLGFTADIVTEYAGADAPRILFTRPLPP